MTLVQPLRTARPKPRPRVSITGAAEWRAAFKPLVQACRAAQARAAR